MEKKVIQIFLIVCLVLTLVFGGCARSETPKQPEEPVPESILDSDGDGMSDWFEENIAHLDPLTPNDRYAIIVNTITLRVHPRSTKQFRKETTNLKTFLIEEEKFKPENVFLFMDKEATRDNFRKAIDYLAKTSDENDLIYIMLYGHGSENYFTFHTGKDPSEFELTPQEIKLLRERFIQHYLEAGMNEAKVRELAESDYFYESWLEDERIDRAAGGYSLHPDELNELISKIKHKKMLFMVECCGGRELGEKISGESLVVIAREFFTGTARTLIRSTVNPDAIDKGVKGIIPATKLYGESSLIKIDDGNTYPSITEVLAASLIDNHIKPWKEVREKSGLDCEKVLAMTDAREIIEYVTDFESNLKQITPKMIDPQEIADNFYFGEAKIGNYRETTLYLLPSD